MRVAHGRAALVMGSSRGLGAVIARRLARGGGTAEAFGAAVTHEQQAAELVAAITGRSGPVDVLVLNATGPRQPEVNRPPLGWDGGVQHAHGGIGKAGH